MARRTRWQDWMNFVLAGWLFCSPWALGYRGEAARNAWMLGTFAFIVSIWIVTGPGSRPLEATILVLGGCAFVTPWALGIAGSTVAWDDWIVGGAIVTLAAWGYGRTPAGLPVLPEGRSRDLTVGSSYCQNATADGDRKRGRARAVETHPQPGPRLRLTGRRVTATGTAMKRSPRRTGSPR